MQMKGSKFTNTNEVPISSKSSSPTKFLRATSLQEARQLLKDCTRVGGHYGRGGNMTPTWAPTPGSVQLSLNSAPSPDQIRPLPGPPPPQSHCLLTLLFSGLSAGA